MLYSEKVMDHFRNPRNVGEIENADGVGQVGNAKCGDIMRMTLKIDDGVITDAKFTTFGCGSAIATGSIAAFIGGGGLGEAIFRGITMYNVEMTFSGALLLVLLALACDYSLSFLEKHIKKKWRMN